MQHSIPVSMETHIQAREFGWTDSNDSDFSIDPFAEDQESDWLSSEEEEVPFARHGPLVHPNPEEIEIQRDF